MLKKAISCKKVITRNNHQIIKCKRYVMIDNKITARGCPAKFLSQEELKIYLHLCYQANDKYSKTFYGHKNFISKVQKISPSKYKHAIHKLSNLGLIAVENLEDCKTIINKTIKMFPIIDPATECPYFVTNNNKSKVIFDIFKIHYTMVPEEAFKIILKLDTEDLMLMLRLYHYFILKTFESCDPNVIRKDPNDWFIHRRLLFDLSLSKAKIENALMRLIESGLIFKKSVLCYKELVDKDSRIKILLDGITEKDVFNTKVLVPRYQLDDTCMEEPTNEAN